MNDQPACIDWRDDKIPVSRQFDDPYFSLDDGLAETRYVFLAGNDLPSRFTGDFRIGELGFGTGLNFLVAWQAWEDAGATGRLIFTSFEAFPMTPADMARALAAFPQVAEKAAQMLAAIERGGWQHDFGSVTLNVVIGDVRDTLPASDLQADAWFLDGFSPAKNPEMWGPDVMTEVARHTAPHGTAATYTAAGHVRKGLIDAGFDVERIKGYGRKRHMTRARITG